jgi:hypothetical protein
LNENPPAMSHPGQVPRSGMRAGIQNDLIFRDIPGFPLQFIPRLMRGGNDKACHPFPVEWGSHWEIQHAPCKAEGNLAWLLKMQWKNGLLRG